jgi:alpha-D-ribose 1-methylphosphonate 5-triphosphate diphosphatase
LETGQRADFVLVDDAVPGQPRVVASVVAGALRFALRAFETGTLR